MSCARVCSRKRAPDDDRLRLGVAFLGGVVFPGERELRDVTAMNLRERGMARAGVVAAVTAPIGIGGTCHKAHARKANRGEHDGHALHRDPLL